MENFLSTLTAVFGIKDSILRETMSIKILQGSMTFPDNFRASYLLQGRYPEIVNSKT